VADTRRKGHEAPGRDAAPMINSPPPRATVDHRVTVPAKEGPLLTASRVLSPRRTKKRAQALSRAREVCVGRSLGALRANAVLAHEKREARADAAEKRSGPEDHSWGPLFTVRSSNFARPMKWLQR